MRFSVKCAFPHLGKRGATSRKSAFCVYSLTEKRILQPAGHGKAQSACALSRKSALCMRAVTQTASLRHGGTAWGSECAFLSRHGHRMRLYVSVWGQSALFRKLRFSSPGQTRRRLTEKRILRVAPHGKAHSAYAPHQKTHSAGERSRTLHASGRAHCIDADTRVPTPDSPYPSTPSPTT